MARPIPLDPPVTRMHLSLNSLGLKLSRTSGMIAPRFRLKLISTPSWARLRVPTTSRRAEALSHSYWRGGRIGGLQLVKIVGAGRSDVAQHESDHPLFHASDRHAGQFDMILERLLVERRIQRQPVAQRLNAKRDQLVSLEQEGIVGQHEHGEMKISVQCPIANRVLRLERDAHVSNDFLPA